MPQVLAIHSFHRGLEELSHSCYPRVFVHQRCFHGLSTGFWFSPLLQRGCICRGHVFLEVSCLLRDPRALGTHSIEQRFEQAWSHILKDSICIEPRSEGKGLCACFLQGFKAGFHASVPRFSRVSWCVLPAAYTFSSVQILICSLEVPSTHFHQVVSTSSTHLLKQPICKISAPQRKPLISSIRQPLAVACFSKSFSHTAVIHTFAAVL
ncbi:hypothetical protein O6H91_23G002300 [Diphasiastrum complanatum]|uniref:Uncharacterized protein n=1 Tax=Diphasiastrum complanatum TaxID=34168 RepID=A0ACC2A7W4_DIPCM|nr:hypothetical protein O6H91_23G002300 [Diphasiastrum complanatum]